MDATAEAKAKWTADELVDLLRARHGESFAFLTQVPDATGFSKSRTADALAMGLWPSKGIHLHGFEVKVSRSDWLREIQDHTKAEAFSKHCHFWWVVASPKIVKVEELPAFWGLLEPGGDSLKVRRPATSRPDVQLPSFEFLAGLLRRVAAQSETETAAKAAYTRGVEEGKKIVASRNRDARSREDKSAALELRHLKNSVAEFEKVSGIQIEMFGGKRLGDAVKLARRLHVDDVSRLADSLEREASRLRSTFEGIREALESFAGATQ